jgi:hypothetical protein
VFSVTVEKIKGKLGDMIRVELVSEELG